MIVATWHDLGQTRQLGPRPIWWTIVFIAFEEESDEYSSIEIPVSMFEMSKGGFHALPIVVVDRMLPVGHGFRGVVVGPARPGSDIGSISAPLPAV